MEAPSGRGLPSTAAQAMLPAMHAPPSHPAPLPDPDRRLAEAARASRDRVQRVEIDGRVYWIKRVEKLSGLMRWQKGNPGRALERERSALRALAGSGLPVPGLAAEGDDFIATPDSGPSLDKVHSDPAIGPGERRDAFAAAGSALAAFHRAGHVHGRPSLRDFCWKDGRITLIDLERYDPRANTPRRMRNDAVIFVFNLYALCRGDSPEVGAAIAAYRDSAPAGLWESGARLCRRLRWIDPLTRTLQRRDAGHGEFRAIPLTLRRFDALR